MYARPERSWKVSHADIKGKHFQAEGPQNVRAPKPGLSEQREVSGAGGGKEECRKLSTVFCRVQETTGGQTTEHLVGHMVTQNLFSIAGKTLKGKLAFRRLTRSAVWRTDWRATRVKAGASVNTMCQAEGHDG